MLLLGASGSERHVRLKPGQLLHPVLVEPGHGQRRAMAPGRGLSEPRPAQAASCPGDSLILGGRVCGLLKYTLALEASIRSLSQCPEGGRRGRAGASGESARGGGDRSGTHGLTGASLGLGVPWVWANLRLRVGLWGPSQCPDHRQYLSSGPAAARQRPDSGPTAARQPPLWRCDPADSGPAGHNLNRAGLPGPTLTVVLFWEQARCARGQARPGSVQELAPSRSEPTPPAKAAVARWQPTTCVNAALRSAGRPAGRARDRAAVAVAGATLEHGPGQGSTGVSRLHAATKSGAKKWPDPVRWCSDWATPRAR